MKSPYALSLSVLSLLLTASVRLPAADVAPRATYEGRRIANVRFDPPAQPVASDDLNSLLTWKPGDPLHLADVRDTIKRLYATGAYASIDISAEPAASAGVEVVIRTTEQWFIGPIEARGKVNLPPSEGQLADAAQLQLGQPFNDDDLDRAVKGMRALLERNGLYNAQITPSIARDAAHQDVAITFQVDSGKRGRLTAPVVTGETRLPEEEVSKAAKYKGWFKWKPATDSNVQAGVRNILNRYSKKDRLTANVTLDKRDYVPSQNRVGATIHADGGPVVKITAQEAKISQGNLKKYVPVFEEQSVNNDLLVNGARNLRDYFQFQGYFDVQVDFTTATPSKDLEQITYHIGLGERHKVAALTIAGNRYFKTAEIRARMYTEPAGFIRLRHGRYSQSFAARDDDAIAALYHDNGFRDVKVSAATQNNYQGKKGDVAVTFHIQEGSQYLVSSLRVDGLSLPNSDKVLHQLASAPGQPYSETNVANDRAFILSQCQSAGYSSATFDFRAQPVPGENKMAVAYTVVLGPKQTVREVVITGLQATRQRLIKPTISVKAGDPLSLDAMGAMQRELYNLGVFDKVDMAVQDPDGALPDKYVLFHLTEAHKYYTAIGVGAQIARFGGSQNSLNAPSGTTGFAPNFDFELSRLNLWGLGQSINFKSRYSTIDRRVSLNYLVPRFRNVEGRNISVTALYDNTRDVLTFTAVRYEGSVQYSQKLSKPTTLLVRYTWRDSKVDQATLKINPLLIPLFSQPSRVAEIGASLVQDKRDDPTNAHNGIYNSLDVDLAQTDFGGNKNFLRFLGRNSYYKTFHGVYTLASNTEFGVIYSYNLGPNFIPSTYIPLPERFSAAARTPTAASPTNRPARATPTPASPSAATRCFSTPLNSVSLCSATTSAASSSMTWATSTPA